MRYRVIIDLLSFAVAPNKSLDASGGGVFLIMIANANLFAKTHDILFQVMLEPMKSDQVHLCSGYVIPAGNSLVAYTNWGMAPEQYVSISVTGYLTDQ